MKIRIFALAKELDIDSKLLIEYCNKAGIVIKNSALASISPDEKDRVMEIIRAAGNKLRLVHVADTMDHRRSHGLRYITNPPGSPARVHQHLKIGDGDVDWDEFFGALADIDFYNRPDTVMVSSVFAEDENAHEVSRYQLNTMTEYVSKFGR